VAARFPSGRNGGVSFKVPPPAPPVQPTGPWWSRPWSLVNVLEDALEVVLLGQPSGTGVTTLIPVNHIVACTIEEG